MPTQNPEVAEILKKVGDLLEIEGESRFKIEAYRDVAHTMDGHSRTPTSARG
jgi:DNA polymerase/3'-5' exonuclease PolX